MSNLITTEERVILKELILLPYIETMIDRSISEVESSNNILKKSYIMAAEYIRIQVLKDRRKLSDELKRRGIKITNEEPSDFAIFYSYTCRGYAERFGINKDLMRTEISIRLTKYTSELGIRLKENRV